MIPPCLCNSWGISSDANLAPNTAWITKAGVLLPWRCFRFWYIQMPHTSLWVSPPDSAVCPVLGHSSQKRETGKRDRRNTQKERGKWMKKYFLLSSPKKISVKLEGADCCQACQSPDSQLQSPGTNVIIAKKLKSLTVTIASGKTPAPRRKNQWQERGKKN